MTVINIAGMMRAGICILFLFIPSLLIFGYQSSLETKGVNDPRLSFSIYKTTILLDISLKLLLLFYLDDFEIYSLLIFFCVLAFFIMFWVRLSLSIPKTSLRKFRKFPQQTNYNLLGFKVISWGITSLLFNFFILLICWNFSDYSSIMIELAILVPWVALLLIMAFQSLARLDRLKFPSIRSLNSLNNNNPPIILLRSFKLDSFPLLNGKVFDESICAHLDLNNNPIVSLANPDEILPSGGSLKIQAKDDDWQKVIKEILSSCRAVILVEGLSDGLIWEISKLRELISPSQLFIMIPDKKYRELAWCYNDDAGSGLFSIMRNAHRLMALFSIHTRKANKKLLNHVWLDFKSKLQVFGIFVPQDFPGNNSLLRFNHDWKGEIVINMNRTENMLNYVVSSTHDANITGFNYQKLAQKIASFEVNGFLDEKKVLPFKNLIGECNKLGRVVACVSFILFVLSIILL